MSYQRTRCTVDHIAKTKTIIMAIEYSGDLEQDTAIAKESMCLLLGDAWHAYADELGLKPLETMAMIDGHIGSQGKKP